jgi:hypothetical protein
MKTNPNPIMKGPQLDAIIFSAATKQRSCSGQALAKNRTLSLRYAGQARLLAAKLVSQKYPTSFVCSPKVAKGIRWVAVAKGIRS